LVVGSHSFVEISGGASYSFARKANGEVWAWGYNGIGELGDNTTARKSSPVLVVGSHTFSTLDLYAPLNYRHGVNPDSCQADDWKEYREPFTSLGYVQLKLES